jgi:hypothetical protein
MLAAKGELRLERASPGVTPFPVRHKTKRREQKETIESPPVP